MPNNNNNFIDNNNEDDNNNDDDDEMNYSKALFNYFRFEFSRASSSSSTNIASTIKSTPTVTPTPIIESNTSIIDLNINLIDHHHHHHPTITITLLEKNNDNILVVVFVEISENSSSSSFINVVTKNLLDLVFLDNIIYVATTTATTTVTATNSRNSNEKILIQHYSSTLPLKSSSLSFKLVSNLNHRYQLQPNKSIVNIIVMPKLLKMINQNNPNLNNNLNVNPNYFDDTNNVDDNDLGGSITDAIIVSQSLLDQQQQQQLASSSIGSSFNITMLNNYNYINNNFNNNLSWINDDTNSNNDANDANSDSDTNNNGGGIIDESVFSLWTLEYMSIIGFYSLIILVGLTGNLLVCRVAFGTRQMRTTTNLLIASLACSDIVMIVFNIPFNVVRMLPISWPFWNALCILAPLIQYSCVYVSTFTMTLIALHRLWMVRQRSTVSIGKSSTKKLAMMVLGIWLMALTLSIPHAAFNRVREKLYHGRILYRCRVQYPEVDFNFPLMMTVEVLITQYLLPLSITLVVYVKIGIVIARQGALICKLSDERKRRQSEAKRRRIFMLALAVATFATCWAPINLYVLLVDMRVLQFNQVAFIMCHWFAMSSVCYNPIIYCWLNEKFRNGARQSLRTILEFAHLSSKRPQSVVVGTGMSGGGNGNVNPTGGAGGGFVNQIILNRNKNDNKNGNGGAMNLNENDSMDEDGPNISSTLVTTIVVDNVNSKRNGSCIINNNLLLDSKSTTTGIGNKHQPSDKTDSGDNSGIGFLEDSNDSITTTTTKQTIITMNNSNPNKPNPREQLEQFSV